jgi:hypothetical protein
MALYQDRSMALFTKRSHNGCNHPTAKTLLANCAISPARHLRIQRPEHVGALNAAALAAPELFRTWPRNRLKLVREIAWCAPSSLRQQISYMNTGVKAKDQEFLKAIIPTHTSIRSHRLRRLVS